MATAFKRTDWNDLITRANDFIPYIRHPAIYDMPDWAVTPELLSEVDLKHVWTGPDILELARHVRSLFWDNPVVNALPSTIDDIPDKWKDAAPCIDAINNLLTNGPYTTVVQNEAVLRGTYQASWTTYLLQPDGSRLYHWKYHLVKGQTLSESWPYTPVHPDWTIRSTKPMSTLASQRIGIAVNEAYDSHAPEPFWAASLSDEQRTVEVEFDFAYDGLALVVGPT